MQCGAELCDNWHGGAGCICDVMDIEADERPVVDQDGLW